MSKPFLATTAAFSLFIGAAQAMPVGAPAGTSDGNIVNVVQGCGPAGHRGPFGGCRPLGNCPRGWHTGPYGVVCTPNRPVRYFYYR